MSSNQIQADQYIKQANALHREEAYDEAIAAYRSAIALMPETPTYLAYHFMIGDMLVEMRRCAEAISEFQSAVKAVPFYDEAWLALGKCLMEVSRLGEAVVAFKKCIEILGPRGEGEVVNPQYQLEVNQKVGEAWYLLAGCYVELGRDGDGVNSLAEAIKLRPELRRKVLKSTLLAQYVSTLDA